MATNTRIYETPVTITLDERRASIFMLYMGHKDRTQMLTGQTRLPVSWRDRPEVIESYGEQALENGLFVSELRFDDDADPPTVSLLSSEGYQCTARRNNFLRIAQLDFYVDQYGNPHQIVLKAMALSGINPRNVISVFKGTYEDLLEELGIFDE